MVPLEKEHAIIEEERIKGENFYEVFFD